MNLAAGSFTRALVIMLLALGGLMGCGSTTPGIERLTWRSPPPPGLESDLAPREGEALKRANLSLPEILASLPSPDYLPPLSVGSVSRATAPEISLSAQRAYAAGRHAARSGRPLDAIAHFNSALALAPG